MDDLDAAQTYSEILATGKFVSARLVRVLIEEEMGGVTYSAQYTTDSKETLEKYYQEDGPRFRAEIDYLEIKFSF
jgi:phosphoribosylamine-glycine ligase